MDFWDYIPTPWLPCTPALRVPSGWRPSSPERASLLGRAPCSPANPAAARALRHRRAQARIPLTRFHQASRVSTGAPCSSWRGPWPRCLWSFHLGLLWRRMAPASSRRAREASSTATSWSGPATSLPRETSSRCGANPLERKVLLSFLGSVHDNSIHFFPQKEVAHERRSRPLAHLPWFLTALDFRRTRCMPWSHDVSAGALHRPPAERNRLRHQLQAWQAPFIPSRRWGGEHSLVPEIPSKGEMLFCLAAHLGGQ